MRHLYRLLLLLIFAVPLATEANSGFVKLLFGIEPTQVLEGKDKSAVVLTKGYLGSNGFNYIQQTDSLGNIKWLTNLFPVQDTTVKFGVDMFMNNETVLIMTHHRNGAGKLLQKLSTIKDGNILSTQTVNNPDSLQPLSLRSYIVTPDSSIIHVLQQRTTNTFYLQKINKDAGIVWTKELSRNNFNAALDTITLFGTQYQVRLKRIAPGKIMLSGI